MSSELVVSVMNDTSSVEGHRFGGSSIMKRGGLAVALSIVANAAVLWIALAADIAPGFSPLSWPPVLLLTIVGAAGGTVVYWLVARRSERPARQFTVIAAIVLVLSFIPDVVLLPGTPDATTAGIVVLMLMHVIVAAICVGALTGVRRRQ